MDLDFVFSTISATVVPVLVSSQTVNFVVLKRENQSQSKKKEKVSRKHLKITHFHITPISFYLQHNTNGIMKRQSRSRVPSHCCLPLVGDAHRSNTTTHAIQHIAHPTQHITHTLHQSSGFLLYPATEVEKQKQSKKIK